MQSSYRRRNPIHNFRPLSTASNNPSQLINVRTIREITSFHCFSVFWRKALTWTCGNACRTRIGLTAQWRRDDRSLPMPPPARRWRLRFDFCCKSFKVAGRHQTLQKSSTNGKRGAFNYDILSKTNRTTHTKHPHPNESVSLIKSNWLLFSMHMHRIPICRVASLCE